MTKIMNGAMVGQVDLSEFFCLATKLADKFGFDIKTIDSDGNFYFVSLEGRHGVLTPCKDGVDITYFAPVIFANGTFLDYLTDQVVMYNAVFIDKTRLQLFINEVKEKIPNLIEEMENPNLKRDDEFIIKDEYLPVLDNILRQKSKFLNVVYARPDIEESTKLTVTYNASLMLLFFARFEEKRLDKDELVYIATFMSTGIMENPPRLLRPARFYDFVTDWLRGNTDLIDRLGGDRLGGQGAEILALKILVEKTIVPILEEKTDENTETDL